MEIWTDVVWFPTTRVFNHYSMLFFKGSFQKKSINILRENLWSNENSMCFEISYVLSKHDWSLSLIWNPKHCFLKRMNSRPHEYFCYKQFSHFILWIPILFLYWAVHILNSKKSYYKILIELIFWKCGIISML